MCIANLSNKIRNIFRPSLPLEIKAANINSPIGNEKIQSAVNLNNSPANFNRPKINNLSSKLLLDGRGKVFDFSDIPAEKFISSVDYKTPVTNRFLDKNHKFKSEYNAEELPILNKKIDECYDISNNAYPYGSIAITKSFDDTITTSGLWQCAALAIVDKKENVQTLLHLCPTVLKAGNDSILDYLLKFGNTENIEFTIVPGTDDITDNTMGILVDKIREKHPKANINFKHFAEDADKTLVLKNGELYSTSHENIQKYTVNPMEDIVYCDY